MRRRGSDVWSIGAALAASTLSACGGGDGTTTPPACVVQDVSVAPAAATLQVASTLALTVGITQQNCGTVAVTWTSTSAHVASVSATGVVTGLAPGSTTVSASAGGRSGTSAITVVPGPVFTVSITPGAPSVEVGQTLQLAAAARDTLGNPVATTVTWATSDATVATVNASGLASGVRAGTATISATAGGRTGSVTLTVTAPSVATVTLTPGTRTVDAGTTLLVHAQPRAASGVPIQRPVIWSVSSATLARVVTSSGNVASVELLATGNVNVIATAEGKSVTLPLVVSARRPRFAYAYVSDTTFAYDTTDLAYSSSGGQVVVQQRAVAEWRVLFLGLRLNISTEPMLPVVRMMGAQSGSCTISSRYTGQYSPAYGDVYGVDVRCLGSDGSPQPRPFLIAAFGSNHTTIPWAYAEITDSVSALTDNVFVPGSGAATSSRTANDVYRLQFSPLLSGYDIWHPVSMSPGLTCASMAPVGSGNSRGVDLDCVNASGARSRSKSGLFVMINGRHPAPRADAMISADGTIAATPVTVAPELAKPATGVYNVRVTPPGVNSTRYPAMIVTAVRSAANPTVACRIVSLTTPIVGTVQARVECRDTQGNLRDHPFAFSAVY
ncbi:MAG: Ig-like domain-containing protein [Gemmatimonadaceae bacterium]